MRALNNFRTIGHNTGTFFPLWIYVKETLKKSSKEEDSEIGTVANDQRRTFQRLTAIKAMNVRQHDVSPREKSHENGLISTEINGNSVKGRTSIKFGGGRSVRHLG